MPSSSVHTFTDPDEFSSLCGDREVSGAAIRQGTMQISVTRRGRYAAALTSINLHHLWMQQCSETLPRVAQIDGWAQRAIIAFRTKPGPSLVRSGREMEPTGVLWAPPGQNYYQTTGGPVSQGAMSLPSERLAGLSAAIIGRELWPPKDILTVSTAALARLQRLHADASQLAKDAPALLAHPETARGLEQALTEAMIDCLAEAEDEEDRSAHRRHATIMRRFHRAIEQSDDQPLYLPELCTEVGASERTLRACCYEHLGMGPKRYLVLRRMHLVRRALRGSTAADTTVTEIATRYGFWQFGKLALHYKAFFGESPSATLARRVKRSKEVMTHDLLEDARVRSFQRRSA